MRPLLPTLDATEKYFREIDERRWYSNFGELATRLEEALAIHFGLPRRNAALVANGTTALSAALLAVGAKPGTRCLLPSWTFVASVSAVQAANLVPHFIDVEPSTWQSDPEKIRERTDLAGVGAVMGVSPFGSPINTRAWDKFWTETGIPVVIDAAASFDTAASVPESSPGHAPVMISLHATKAFGIGEGGLVLSTSGEIVQRVRQICNFGLWKEPQSEMPGYNGKLSEYHAAVGLAMLDGWAQRRAALQSRTERYISELARLPDVRMLPLYGAGWVSVYCTVLLPTRARIIEERMKSLGVQTRRWWCDGVSAQPAYRGALHDELPVTAMLADRALSLPFYHDMSDKEIAGIADGLNSSLEIP
jgi:dTDP-4-amino-4,6-dideoxygalactose transaminase